MIETHIRTLAEEIINRQADVWEPVVAQKGPWSFRSYRIENMWRDKTHLVYPALQESVRRLRARWPDDHLSVMVADMYFNHRLWEGHYYQYSRDQPAKINWEGILDMILDNWLRTCCQPPDMVSRLEDRILFILDHPCHNESRPDSGISWNCFPPDGHLLAPQLARCIDLLTAIPASDASLALMDRIVDAGLDKTIEDSSTGSRSTLYQKFDMPFEPMMARLFECGRMSFDRFLAVVDLNPEVLTTFSTMHQETTGAYTMKGLRYLVTECSPAFAETMNGYVARLVEEILERDDDQELERLKRVKTLTDARWLLEAARLHHNHEEKRLVLKKKGDYDDHMYRAGMDAVVIYLAGSATLENDPAAQQQLVEQLKTIPTQTLKYLLPVTGSARPALLKALGWERAERLIETLQEVAEKKYDPGHFSAHGDIPNGNDPASGVMDVARIRQVTADADDDLAREIFDLFTKAKIGVSHTAMLFQAALGWNRAEVEKGIGKRNQHAVKAYGLLPLERGEDEALERYLFFKRFAKEASKFGPERQVNERAAVQTALANLAQVAGYPDVLRLEWAMEAHLASDVVPGGRTWEIEGYRIELTLDGADAGTAITRGGKPIKNVPPGVRKHAAYAEVKAAVAALRAQHRRFRAAFEDLMAQGAAITRDDLANLQGMPVATFLLGRLILQTDDGVFGLYLPEEIAVETLSGEHQQVAREAVIAHPYHLFSAGQLADWQRRVVRLRIVQPFKQAFRELYVITPAEREARIFSNRFAGHLMDGKVAARLFEARGWELQDVEVALPHKLFHKQGFEARFQVAEGVRYLGQEPVTSDRISFRWYPERPETKPTRDDPYRGYIPLEDILPLVFSEVMRDADLVVSVAQMSERAVVSNEVYARRAELVTTLLEELRLTGVKIEGHFAHVSGRLANYRVHLGSAAIHIEPGSYLCIVPDKWGQTHEKLFLPFADAGDAKISEVISKVLLLLNDDKIKDETILRQIKRQTGQQEAPDRG